MKNSMKKIVATVMAFTLLLTVFVSNVSITASAEAATTQEDYYFYLMVDPGETASGFIMQPTCIEIPAGTLTSKPLGELVCNSLLSKFILFSCTGSYGYIKSIRCFEAGNYSVTSSSYSMYDSLPEVAFHDKLVQPMNPITRMLGEFNFTGYSGWMMTINNETMDTLNNATYYYSMATTVQDLMDMDLVSEDDTPVVELMFSLNMGADVGICDSYLPTEVTYYDSIDKYYYNWSGNYNFVPRADKADRSELVIALADNKQDPDYNSSLNVLKNITASESSVNTAIANLDN